MPPLVCPRAPRRAFLCLALCAAALGAVGPAAAQPRTGSSGARPPGTGAPDTTRVDLVLPAVEVTALRGQTAAGEGAAHVVRLTRRDLDDLRAVSLADALDRTGTMSVRRYGPGGLATASLRGAASGQTALLLDGLRLSDPVVGPVDLTLLPAALLGSVTTLGGAASAWHGTDALAGAVLLDPRATRGLDLRLGVGAAGTATADVAAGAGPVSAALALETSAGDFAYRDRATFPARTAHRQGADRQSAAALVRVDAGPKGSGHTATGRTRLGLWLARADRGIPGAAGTAADAGARQRDDLARLWATRTGHVGARTAWRAAAFAHAAFLHYRGPGTDSRSRPVVVGGEVGVRHAASFGSWLSALGGGLSASRTTVRNDALAASPVEHAGAVWGNADGVLGPVTLTGALRLDVIAQSGATYAPMSPRVGVRIGRGASAGQGGVALRASAGRAFRAPSISDRYWKGAGRDDLRPERGWTADMGVDVRRGAASGAATVFVRRQRDEIVWRPGADGVWRPGNVRRTAAVGVEAVGEGAVGPLRVRASASALEARDRSGDAATDGRVLPYVPRWTLRGDARAPVASIAGARLALDAAASATGRRTTTADASSSLPAFATLDLGAALATARLAVDVRLANALGADYVLVEGHPMPGRAASASLRLRL